MTPETTMRKRHRRYFNHVSRDKLDTITRARDAAVDAADKRNDERVLTLIRKHLAQFNLQNHAVFVGYGEVLVKRNGMTSHVWECGKYVPPGRIGDVIAPLLGAVAELRLHDCKYTRVA